MFSVSSKSPLPAALCSPPSLVSLAPLHPVFPKRGHSPLSFVPQSASNMGLRPMTEGYPCKEQDSV